MRISDWSSDVCSSDLSIGANWTIRATYTHRDTDQESLLFAGGSGYPNRDGSGLGVWDYYGVTEQQEDYVDVYASGKFSLFGREHELVLGGTRSEERRVGKGWVRTCKSRCATQHNNTKER